MNILNVYLPKDLVNIIEDYAKDRTNYEKVLSEFRFRVGRAAAWRWLFSDKDKSDVQHCLEKIRADRNAWREIRDNRSEVQQCLDKPRKAPGKPLQAHRKRPQKINARKRFMIKRGLTLNF